MLSTRTQPFGTASTGYLFNKDEKKTLKIGLAGKFLFTSEVLDVPNNSIRFQLFRRLATSINSKTGEISGVTSGSVDYAWVALGLNSYQEFTLANKVVQYMLKLQNADGGFGEADQLVSTPFATGLALQAINYRQTFGSDKEDAIRAAAEKKAVSFLLANDLEDNHWAVSGEASVTSTAYAVMGLKASGVRKKTLARYTNWLKEQLAPKGGLRTSASNGDGDKFATAQSYVALIGKSYLELLP
jgi:prenyltransferase beta subunit